MNLAFDETLLNSAETGRTGEILRVWESPVLFVVIGVAQVLRREVRADVCSEQQVSVLRRCSGGGAVLQGPGCLNYTLVLHKESRPEINTIRGSYCYVLNRLSDTFRTSGLPVRHNGISDLAIRGKKAGGSAQKRRKHFILHHGTILYDMDPAAIEMFLKEPLDRPRYRGNRTHSHFVVNLPLGPEQLRALLRDAFDVEGNAPKPPQWQFREAKELAHKKYNNPNWNLRQ